MGIIIYYIFWWIITEIQIHKILNTMLCFNIGNLIPFIRWIFFQTRTKMPIDTQKEGIEVREGETKLCKSRPVPQKEDLVIITQKYNSYRDTAYLKIRTNRGKMWRILIPGLYYCIFFVFLFFILLFAELVCSYL